MYFPVGPTGTKEGCGPERLLMGPLETVLAPAPATELPQLQLL